MNSESARSESTEENFPFGRPTRVSTKQLIISNVDAKPSVAPRLKSKPTSKLSSSAKLKFKNLTPNHLLQIPQGKAALSQSKRNSLPSLNLGLSLQQTSSENLTIEQLAQRELPGLQKHGIPKHELLSPELPLVESKTSQAMQRNLNLRLMQMESEGLPCYNQYPMPEKGLSVKKLNAMQRNVSQSELQFSHFIQLKKHEANDGAKTPGQTSFSYESTIDSNESLKISKRAINVFEDFEVDSGSPRNSTNWKSAATAMVKSTLKFDEKYIISMKNPMKEKWDFFILLLAFQNSLVIPIDMSFEPEWAQNMFYQIFDNFVDFLFLVDMVLMCMTSILNDRGKELFDSFVIIKRYVFSVRFVTDSFAILGTGIVTSYYPQMKIFGFFKMIRIFRLGTMIARLNVPEVAKAWINLCKLTFYLCLYNHVFGCAWYYITAFNADYDKVDKDGFIHTWYPPTDWLNYADSKLFTDEYSKTQKYVIALYHSILMLGFNEMGPVNKIEMFFCVVTMLSASIINAQIFGDIAVLIAKLQKKKTEYQSQLDNANTVMANLNLPMDVQMDILDYFKLTIELKDIQDQLKKFMSQISRSKRDKVEQTIFEINLRKNVIVQQVIYHIQLKEHEENTKFGRGQVKIGIRSPLASTPGRTVVTGLGFQLEAALHKSTALLRLPTHIPQQLAQKECDEFLRMIIGKLRTCITSPEEEILTQNEFGMGVYFISRGDCAVMYTDQNGKTHISSRLLTEGDHFGEVALLYKCKRTATVVSRNYNTMARMNYSEYKAIVAEYPHFEKLLKVYSYRYNDMNKQFYMGLLKKVAFLRGDLTQEVLHQIIYSIQTKIILPEECLKKEGELIQSIYFVQNGILEVSTELEGHRFVIDRLHQGSVVNVNNFLLEKEEAQVSIHSYQTSSILVLSRATLTKIAAEHDSFDRRLQSFQNATLKFSEITKKVFALDYQLQVPKLQIPRILPRPRYYQMLQRRSIIKNIVMQEILKIRRVKRAPSLRLLLTMVKKFNDQEKERFILKLKKLYAREQGIYEEDIDVKYDKLVQAFHRIFNICHVVIQGFDQIERKIGILQVRRNQREDMTESVGVSYYLKLNNLMMNMNPIKKAKIKEIDLNLKTCLDVVRTGNPFNRQLHNIRYAQKYDFALSDGEGQARRDMDPTFKKYLVRGTRTGLDRRNLKKLGRNPVERAVAKFERLTKMAGKLKPPQELSGFISPQTIIDLNLFRKKKRKDFVRLYRLKSQKFKLKNYDKVFGVEAIIDEAHEMSEDDESDSVTGSPHSPRKNFDHLNTFNDDSTDAFGMNKVQMKPSPKKKKRVEIHQSVSHSSSSDEADKINSQFEQVYRKLKSQDRRFSNQDKNTRLNISKAMHAARTIKM